MRLIPRFFAIGLLAGAALQAAPLQSEYRLNDRGEWKSFEVARDELHHYRAYQRLTAALLRTTEQMRPGDDLVLYPKGAVRDSTNRRFATSQVAVRLMPTADPGTVARLVNGRVLRRVGGANGWYLIQVGAQPAAGLDAAARLQHVPGVLDVEAQLAREQVRRSVPNDPFFGRQWHLQNTGQGNGTAGIDVDVTGVWDQYRGAGITVGVVDDGLEHTHPDLAPNYDASLSYDFDYHDSNPAPAPFDYNDHGTACAGLVAARGNNNLGVAGVAYEAKLAGLRLIARPTTDAEEAEAFAFRNDAIFIKTNSWGPYDNAKVLAGAGPITRTAIREAVVDGRNGHGTIITWACGNGGDVGDNSNYDGYANLPEAIAVGALGNKGQLASYSEQGANVLVVAPSSGGSLGITTVDRRGEDGYNYTGNRLDLTNRDYTEEFGGTSAAAPIAAGVIALIIQANPQLGWRDVREILIRSARQVDPSDPDWVMNGAGFRFNHKYGAGLIDAGAAVALAQTWANLGPQISAAREENYGAEIIPDNTLTGVEHGFQFTESELRVEHACVTVDIRHGYRGQLRIELESPSGTKSILAPGRTRDHGRDFRSWTFMSVHHWGENAAGTWKVRVIDQLARTVGTLVKTKVELFGSAFPLPIVANGASLTAESEPDGFYEAGENVTVQFALKNITDSAIDNVVATLGAENGVLNPSGPQVYGKLNPGETVTRSFSFTVAGQLGQTIRPALTLAGDAPNLGRALFSAIVGRRPPEPLRVSRVRTLRIPGSGTKGNAELYPDFRIVFPFGLPPGALPVVTKLQVVLHGFTHERTEDVDILLMDSSTGKNVVLMSDAGLGPANNVELTFDDDATQPLMRAPLVSGTYRPKNLGTVSDIMPAPAPRKPYGSMLSVFKGVMPLDVWLLFIRDDKAGAVGSLTGWDLLIDYAY